MKSSDTMSKPVKQSENRAVNSYEEAEEQLHKKARVSDGKRSPVSISEILLGGGNSAAGVVSASNSDTEDKGASRVKSGRWSLDEKLMFLYGLSVFGKGRWKKIHAYVPERSLVQIKSHAQKVLKRVDAGENVFQRLEDNRELLKTLVEEANRRIEEADAKTNQVSKKKRKRTSIRKPPAPITAPTFPSPFELIHGTCKSQEPLSAPPSPSSACSEDPPGVHASQQYDEAVRIQEAKKRRRELDAGNAGVIAAVAALCQLSARKEP